MNAKSLRTIVAALVCLSFALSGCTDDVVEPGAFTDHPESADLEPVVGGGKGDDIGESFDKNRIVGDSFYQDGTGMTVAQMQAFLEDTSM